MKEYKYLNKTVTVVYAVVRTRSEVFNVLFELKCEDQQECFDVQTRNVELINAAHEFIGQSQFEYLFNHLGHYLDGQVLDWLYKISV